MDGMKRDYTLGFRINPLERRGLEALASQAACRPGEYARTLLRRELQARGLIDGPLASDGGMEGVADHA
jgi:hypothetical protein